VTITHLRCPTCGVERELKAVFISKNARLCMECWLPLPAGQYVWFESHVLPEPEPEDAA